MKLKLMAPHYLNDVWLPADTIIGDDTPFPIVDTEDKPFVPSMQMVALDDEAQAAIDHYDIRNKRQPVDVAPPTDMKQPLYHGAASSTVQPQRDTRPGPNPFPPKANIPETKDAGKGPLDEPAEAAKQPNPEREVPGTAAPQTTIPDSSKPGGVQLGTLDKGKGEAKK